MEIRRHDDALSLLAPLKDNDDSDRSGVCLLMSATVLGRLRDRLLLSALGDQEAEQASTSSSEVIGDLVDGLSLLHKSKKLSQPRHGFRSKRYRYIRGRIQLAMPAFLGRAEEGREMMRALLRDLPEEASEFDSERQRLEWNALRALAARSPDKAEREETSERADAIEAAVQLGS